MAKRTFRTTIWGDTWKVVLKKGLKSSDGDRCFGLCDFEHRTIYVDQEQSECEMMDTIIHEVTHAVTRNALSEPYTHEVGRASTAVLLAFNYIKGDQ